MKMNKAFDKYKRDPFTKYKTQKEFADLSNTNYYPISIDDFAEKKMVGNYVIFYCLLPDRIHFEMPIENAVFATQKMLEELPENVTMNQTDKVRMFIRSFVGNKPNSRFHPTPEKAIEYMRLQCQ